jgi:hypothetical protein
MRCVPQDAQLPHDYKGTDRRRGDLTHSIGVDFGVTQVVDGNWGIHAIIKKSLFAGVSV